MSQLILARGSTYRRSLLNQIFKRFQPGPYFLVFSLVFFVAMITVITLIFSTRQITKGYLLSSLDAENQLLVRESEVSDMEISKVRSLQFIEESPKVQRMVKPGQVVFMGGEAVVARN